MKAQIYKWFSCLALVTLFQVLPAQTGITPNGISYQAIARDAAGKELVNMSVRVRFSIIDENNNTDWVETHSVTTDPFGLFNLTIGDGSRDASSNVESFADIPWGTHHYSLKVEIRTDNDSEYRTAGNMPLLSVPYALYAASAGNALNGGKDEQQLSYDNNTHILSLQNGGSVDLSPVTSGDLANALISKIEVRDNVLYITQGEQTQSVNLSQFKQSLTFDAQTNTLSLSGNAAPVDLSQYQYTITWDPVNQHYNLVNGLGQIRGATIDLATYKQTLSLAGRTLSISNGNSIPLPPDADIDSTNELQSLSILNNQLSLINRNGATYSSVSLTSYVQDLNLSNNTLKISNNPDATSIDLTPYKQTLSITGRTLSISNGNSISLPPDADIDSTNELQSLSLQNNQLSLINKNGSTYSTVNLSTYLQDLNLTDNTLKITNNPSATSINLSKYYQQLSLENGQLSLTSGGTVNIRENLYAFRAVNNTNKNIVLALNDSTDFIFPTEKLDLGNVYDKNAGTFTVPSGGAGLYKFDVLYQYNSTNDIIRVVLNDSVYETLQRFSPSSSFLLYLNEGDKVKLRVVNFGTTMIFNGIGSFMGYRINQ